MAALTASLAHAGAVVDDLDDESRDEGGPKYAPDKQTHESCDLILHCEILASGKVKR